MISSSEGTCRPPIGSSACEPTHSLSFPAIFFFQNLPSFIGLLLHPPPPPAMRKRSLPRCYEFLLGKGDRHGALIGRRLIYLAVSSPSAGRLIVRFA